MKKLALSYLIFILLPFRSWAYHCPFEDAYLAEIVYANYTNADLVALVNISNIELHELDDEYSSYRLIYANVVRSWKGKSTNKVVIQDSNSMISGYLPIDIGKNYIFYAYHSEAGGYFDLDICDIEKLGKVTLEQKRILDKIDSKKFKASKYYELFNRMRDFVNYDLIRSIDVKSSKESVRITIELDEDADDWVGISLIRFIRLEGTAMGIGNVGEIDVIDDGDSSVINWIHPKTK